MKKYLPKTIFLEKKKISQSQKNYFQSKVGSHSLSKKSQISFTYKQIYIKFIYLLAGHDALVELTITVRHVRRRHLAWGFLFILEFSKNILFYFLGRLQHKDKR